MALSAGTRLGPYEIQSVIGAGGMGEVYRARDTRLDRIVAIKRSNEQFTARVEREARAIAALNHPRICHLYDIGPGHLVMELARQRGANNPGTGLPTYVRMGGIQGDGPSWLGSAYAPFDTSGQARNNINLNQPLDRVNDRRALLWRFDDVNRDIERSGVMAGLDAFDQQANDLLLGRVDQLDRHRLHDRR